MNSALKEREDSGREEKLGEREREREEGRGGREEGREGGREGERGELRDFIVNTV